MGPVNIAIVPSGEDEFTGEIPECLIAKIPDRTVTGFQGIIESLPVIVQPQHFSPCICLADFSGKLDLW